MRYAFAAVTSDEEVEKMLLDSEMVGRQKRARALMIRTRHMKRERERVESEVGSGAVRCRVV